MKIRCTLFGAMALVALACGFADPAYGFLPGNRWTSTAHGGTGADGDPITLTWSFVPDGTLIPQQGTGSDLLAFLDANFGGGPGGADLAQRPWFRFFSESFARWGELGGVTYVYEPNDDGQTHGAASGALRVRGDVRIGGAMIDGPSGTLAYNQLPNGGDMTLDTGDVAYYTNAASDYIRLRNVVMHEHGHGLGIHHVVSPSDALLMEPTINTSFYGPQLDDIRAIQFYYGDPFEKSHGGLGNDVAARAIDLGVLASGAPLSIGADANLPNQRVVAAQADFVSIDHASDVDYFSFTLSGPALLSASLTPRGGVFEQGAEGAQPSLFDANARADLQLQILDANGVSVLATANSGGIGAIEQVVDLALPDGGAYFARISSLTDSVQLYQLDLTATLPMSTTWEADFNLDGGVDHADLAAWQADLGNLLGVNADADRDDDADGADFLVWQRQFGQGAAQRPFVESVPEPASLGLALAVAIAGRSARRSSGKSGKRQNL